MCGWMVKWSNERSNERTWACDITHKIDNRQCQPGEEGNTLAPPSSPSRRSPLRRYGTGLCRSLVLFLFCRWEYALGRRGTKTNNPRLESHAGGIQHACRNASRRVVRWAR